PLRTELAVSITDAALSYIQKDYTPDIRVYYYGDRRSQSVSSNGSPDTEFQSIDEDTQPTPKYQPHQWIGPEDMGLIIAEQSRGASYRGEIYDGRPRVRVQWRDNVFGAAGVENYKTYILGAGALGGGRVTRFASASSAVRRSTMLVAKASPALAGMGGE